MNLAVPPDPEGKGLKLEDCLEEYFNNKVDVLRDSLEEKKGGDWPSPGAKTTIRVVTEEEELQTVEHIEDSATPTPGRWSGPGVLVQTPLETPTSSYSNAFESFSSSRNRSTSIIQRIVVNDDGQSTDVSGEGFLHRARRTGSTVVKAVTIPAWQFFRLIRGFSPRMTGHRIGC